MQRTVMTPAPVAVDATRAQRSRLQVLTAMETALGDDGVAPPGLLRIEHVQHVSGPGVGARLAKSGIHAVVNPQHMEMDVPVLVSASLECQGPRSPTGRGHTLSPSARGPPPSLQEERLGSGRAGPDRAFPLRMLLDSGARVSAGSDWPVVPLDPLASMLAAVHGPPSAPPGPRFGGATAQEAFLMHTAWAAEAAGLGDVGRLEVGRAADLVVWTRDIVEWLRCAGERGDGCGERPGVGAVYVRGECMVGCEGAVARR